MKRLLELAALPLRQLAKFLRTALCSTCYTLRREDEICFGGMREAVLERDG